MSTVLDAKGRLFGRINLVDAAIAAFVIVLIPIAYATMLLFRPASPHITSVDRAQITNVEERAGGGTQIEGKLKVHGTALRPTLRATIGSRDAVGFIFETPTSADVIFGDVAAGTHDLVLYDGVQEVARAKDAVTIGPKTTVQKARVLAVGHIVGLDERTAAALQVGTKYPASGEPLSEIIALGAAGPDYRRVGYGRGRADLIVPGTVQRSAAVLLSCDAIGYEECRIGGIPVGAVDRLLVVPGAPGNIQLAIKELAPATAPQTAEVRVRFVAYPDVLARAKIGDRDSDYLALDGRTAVIHSLATRGEVAGQIVVGPSEIGGDGERIPDVGHVSIPERLAVADAVLTLGVDAAASGWRYRGQSVKAGGTITFSTDVYTMRGTILGVTPTPKSPRPQGASPKSELDDPKSPGAPNRL
jgi:hypothetical protein